VTLDFIARNALQALNLLFRIFYWLVLHIMELPSIWS
jgi:hypothetical protein